LGDRPHCFVLAKQNGGGGKSEQGRATAVANGHPPALDFASSRGGGKVPQKIHSPRVLLSPAPASSDASRGGGQDSSRGNGEMVR
jgi:hypothetical protein